MITHSLRRRIAEFLGIQDCKLRRTEGYAVLEYGKRARERATDIENLFRPLSLVPDELDRGQVFSQQPFCRFFLFILVYCILAQCRLNRGINPDLLYIERGDTGFKLQLGSGQQTNHRRDSH